MLHRLQPLPSVRHSLSRRSLQLAAALLGAPAIQRLLTRHTLGRYYNYTFAHPDRYSAQSYKLLRHTFSQAELESLQAYQQELKLHDSECSPIIIGRLHKWAYTRELVRSRGQRMELPVEEATTPEAVQMVAVVSGSYLTLDEREAIGALGHMVTHELSRKGQGHGTALYQAFEQELRDQAKKHHRRLRLIVLESQPDARFFWAKQGFRCLEGVHYVQPPLDFDPHTGQPLGEAVAEHLMVKLCSENPSAEERIDQTVLKRAVFALYKHWYVPEMTTFDTAARERVKTFVLEEVFGTFLASLPTQEAPILLFDPTFR